ncbi:hypothetical protein E1B28_012719 [Marasmius oreades]|uniref:Uncharacterized protein n=1 Tax=Marasmius oreades TaxID=181124 RepID=A0A9P7RS23_9AGAR|nr:uncharacterized protein E1B28_012719 [Marasmius oreades]KAG7088751.1 hypothetical protein E1B28_012719 [Marasmius oreades]
MAGDHFPAQYRPNETALEILSEHTWLQGSFLAAVAYGIQFVLYVMASYLLWMHRNQDKSHKNIFLILYISVIFILSTLYMAGLLQFTQESFIDGRMIKGGPNVFENDMFSLPVDMLANVIMVLLSWFCDIINVWRCYVIYKGGRIHPWVVLLIPVLLYFSSVAFGVLFLKQVGTVSQSPWDATGINFTIPYYTMSLALNIIVTILIVLRLLIYRHRITKAMGPMHGSQYTSLVAMVVESAAIYSTFALCFLVPFAVKSPLAQLFLQGLAQIQGVSTFLIIFRIAQGKGWSHDAYTNALTTSTYDAASHTIGGTRKIQFKNLKSKSTFGSGERSAETNEDPIMLKDMHQISSTASDREGVQISKSVLIQESV